jgi:hypothetical protein
VPPAAPQTLAETPATNMASVGVESAFASPTPSKVPSIKNALPSADVPTPIEASAVPQTNAREATLAESTRVPHSWGDGSKTSLASTYPDAPLEVQSTARVQTSTQVMTEPATSAPKPIVHSPLGVDANPSLLTPPRIK